MATFKVGDRAKIVDSPDLLLKHWIGCEVVILGMPGTVRICPDEYIISKPTTEHRCAATYGVRPHHLAPLTDPGADQFIERIKKLSREPINEVPKVTVEK